MMTRLSEDTGLEGREVDVTVADGLVHLWGNVESEALERRRGSSPKGSKRQRRRRALPGAEALRFSGEP